MKFQTRKMEIIQTLTPSRLPYTLGQLLVNLQALQFPENAKFTSTKANTNNEIAVSRPRPLERKHNMRLGSRERLSKTTFPSV